MNLKTLVGKKILNVDNLLDMNFVSSEGVFTTNENPTLKINDKLNLYFDIESDHIQINITNNSNSSVSFLLKIDYDILLEINPQEIVFGKFNKTYVLTGQNSIFDLDNEGVLTIRLSSDAQLLNLYYYNDLYPNITPFTFTVYEGDFDPEFSIGTFDDSSFTIPRQIRQGIPIISTVPSKITSSSDSADIDSYNLGLGKDTRTIHFRIICNKILEDSLTFNQLSTLRLKIYLPAGLDTVRPAIYVPMYFVQKLTAENYSIYRASFDFVKQGFYNGVEYVDGYMYFDVHVPLTIQKTLGFEFDFELP